MASHARDLLRFDEALRGHRLTSPEWTRWVMAWIDPDAAAAPPAQRATWARAIAGGAPGVNAEFDSDGHDTVIVLANLDPPIAQAVVQRLKAALQVLAP